MAKLKFNNLAEINQYLTNETKIALEETLQAMIPKLRFFIDEDIYRAYHPTFYKRTRWLKRRNDVIEHYISNLQHKLRGGIRIVGTIFDSVSDREKFQHGSAYRTKSGSLHTYNVLSAEQFLEILTEGAEGFNPFGFPNIKRRNFWEDFLDWAKDNYVDIFLKKCKKHKIDLQNIGSSDNVILNEPKSKEPSSEPPPTSISGTENDIGRTSIPQKANVRGMYHYVNPYLKKSYSTTSSNAEIDSVLNQLARARNGREMGIESQRAQNAKDSAFGTWDDTE